MLIDANYTLCAYFVYCMRTMCNKINMPGICIETNQITRSSTRIKPKIVVEERHRMYFQTDSIDNLRCGRVT
jgi:hypothetical protein